MGVTTTLKAVQIHRYATALHDSYQKLYEGRKQGSGLTAEEYSWLSTIPNSSNRIYNLGT